MPCNAPVSLPGGFTVRTVTDVRDWEALAGVWDGLLARSRADSPFLTFEWLRAWWDAFGGRDDLHILVLVDGAEVVGLAPLYLRREKVLPGVVVPVLRLLGDGAVAERRDLVVHPDREDEATTALAEALLADPAWASLRLETLDATSRRWAMLEARLAEAGLLVLSDLGDLCPYVPLPGTWQEFLEVPDRTFKRLIEKDARRAGRQHGLTTVYPLPEEAVEPALERLIVLHLEAMRGLHVRSSLEDAAMLRFLRRVTRAFARRGWVALGAGSMDGEMVAVDYTILYGGRCYGFQRGCGAAGRAIKAGNALMLDQVKYLLGTASEFDCLRGEELYKFYWGCRSRLTRHCTVGRGRLGRLLPWLKRLRLAAGGLKRALRTASGR